MWAYGLEAHDGIRPLIADHVDGDTLNNSDSNLVPSCNDCNSHRSRWVSDEEVYIESSDGKRRRAFRRPCRVCQKEFIAPGAEVRRGRGEFCSHKCSAHFKWNTGVLRKENIPRYKGKHANP